MQVITGIIEGFREKTNKNGVLYLLLFDFLYENTFNLAKKFGLFVEIEAYCQKEIRIGGETEKRIEYIESVYTNYKFIKYNNFFAHNILILKIYKI